MQQAEIYAAKLTCPEDIEAYMGQAAADLHVLLDRVGRPAGMQRF